MLNFLSNVYYIYGSPRIYYYVVFKSFLVLNRPCTAGINSLRSFNMLCCAGGALLAEPVATANSPGEGPVDIRLSTCGLKWSFLK